MPKMYGEDFLFKSLYVDYNEIGSFFVPRYDIFILIVLSKLKAYLEDLEGFGDENWRSGNFFFFPFDFLV